MSLPYAVNSVNNITDLKTLIGTNDGDIIEVLGYYSPNDGGGGQFYWDSNPGLSDNGGTVFKPNSGYSGTGRWLRVFDNYVDVKWFGATGRPSTVETTEFQNAIDFITTDGAHNYNLFISKGDYKIDTTLDVDLSLIAWKRIVIYGEGSNESNITMVDQNFTGNSLYIHGATNSPIIEIRDFSVQRIYQFLGTGIELETLGGLSVRNLFIKDFDTGLKLTDTNISSFISCNIYGNNVGIYGVYVSVTPPNLLNFISCELNDNKQQAVKLLNLHSVTFESCNFSVNGANNTPALTQVAGIECTFHGGNGANGLNVTDCYFEGNIGLADIRVQVNTGGQNNPFYGTHTFKGNTFNRNHDVNNDNHSIYTVNNILIVGSGQDPQQLFGRSKCRLVFEGNGFFVNQPGTFNNYQPNALRKAIQIDYATDSLGLNYWEFDIVEQGNTYAGDPNGGNDAPSTAPMSFDTKSPQVSDYTRVKAFGTIIPTDDGVNLSESYNVRNVVADPGGAGWLVTFANELERLPNVVVTPLLDDGFQVFIPFSYAVMTRSTTGFIAFGFDPFTGNSLNGPFHFVVF